MGGNYGSSALVNISSKCDWNCEEHRVLTTKETHKGADKEQNSPDPEIGLLIRHIDTEVWAR